MESNKLFNTPFEMSLRIIMLLSCIKKSITVDRITAYDFIAGYGDMFDVSDTALNGENKFAFSELSVRRNLVKDALKSLVIDRLVTVKEDKSGILYGISNLGKGFNAKLTSVYASQYKEVMMKTVKKFAAKSDIDLFKMISEQSVKYLRR